MKAKERNATFHNIEKQMQILYRKIENKTITEQELKQYDNLKINYDQILEYKAIGRQIRSRVEAIEMNEKSNAYFFNKEKYEYQKK